MAEEALLDGQALQLWELPARLHNNEKMLRDFFTSHFRFTPAAHIQTVFFNTNNNTSGHNNNNNNNINNNNNNNNNINNSNSPCVGGEVTVVFSAREAVRLVLSRIIQHELLEQDKASGMELRRGYVYFGQDRLLVEGIIHLVEAMPSRGSAASSTCNVNMNTTTTNQNNSNSNSHNNHNHHQHHSTHNVNNNNNNSTSMCSPVHPTSHSNRHMGGGSTVVVTSPATSVSSRTRTGKTIHVGNDKEYGNSSSTVETMKPLRIMVGGTVVSNMTNNKHNKNSMHYDRRDNVSHPQDSDWSSEENDTMMDNESDNDDNDDDYEEENNNNNNNNEIDENDSTQPVDSHSTPRTGTSTGAVVLCMTFVCTFDQHQQHHQHQHKKHHRKHREEEKNNEKDVDHSREEENNLVVTPHLIYQLLRTTCFVRKVVMFRRDTANTSDGGAADVNNKRRTVRALVEVGDEDGAKQVVQTFHGVTLELTVPTAKGKRIVPTTTTTTEVKDQEEEEVEVEYRWRLYVRYESGPRTSRELNVPMNTNTTLSVTPQNLALMGPIFKRYWSEHKPHGNSHTNNNNTTTNNTNTTTTMMNVNTAGASSSSISIVDDAMSRHNIQPQVVAYIPHNLQQQQQYDDNNNNMMRHEHDSYDESRHYDRRKRNREHSRDERHHRHSRRRSHEKISSNKQRHRSRDHHSRHQRSHNDKNVDHDINIYPQKITVGEGAIQRSLTMDSGTMAFNSNPHIQQQQQHILLQQQQQQQQQQQLLQVQQSRKDIPLNTLHEMRGNPIPESPYVRATSPPACRAIYSKEHGRMYYVYRDPKTGIEVSSWEPYGN